MINDFILQVASVHLLKRHINQLTISIKKMTTRLKKTIVKIWHKKINKKLKMYLNQVLYKFKPKRHFKT